MSWKPLIKRWPVPAQCSLLAMLLMVCTTTPVWAAERSGATIVLEIQLPPSTSPEAVRGLIADLAAKGAHPATQPTTTFETSAQPAFNAANLAAQVWDGSRQAVQALPFLRRLPQVWVEQVETAGGTPEAAFGFWIVALAVLSAAPLIGVAFGSLADRQQTRPSEVGPTRHLWVAVLRFLAEFASLAVFGVLLWAALLWISRGAPILGESADHLVWFALKWRVMISALIMVVSPERADLRLLAIDDADARICFRWLAVFFALSPLNSFQIWLIERLGFGHNIVFGAALALGLPLSAYKVAMYWAIRRPIARAILAATGGEPGPVRRVVAASWHWFFIFLTLAVFSAASVEFSLGEGAAWVFSAASATTGIIVTLAVLGQASHNLIAWLFLVEGADVRPASRRDRLLRALHHLSDAFLSILGGVWFAETWGLDLFNPAPGSLTLLLVRPILEAAAIIVAAWILWTAISAIIDEKMPRAVVPGEEDHLVPGSTSRLATLLPLLRHAVLIVIVVLGMIAALQRLGLNIGPLLAGLGVIGIAVGFGAQNLVRDVISGVFFLMEDAFRVGEYIQSGSYKGSVEGFSIRSVRLRHHRGPVYTVPFGLLGAIQNQSRDWVIDKLMVGITYDSDLERARKLIKQVGLDLARDPEFAGLILEPLKMQGVEQFGDFAVHIRLKIMTLPGEQFVIRRKAYAMIKKAFDENGIKFAFPMVQVTGEGEAAPAAAAQRALELTPTGAA